MSFEEFQDGHLWCGNRTNLAALNLHVSPMPPTKFQLIIQITLREQMSFQDFPAGHHGSHFRYWNGMILAILNLHVTPMPPTMFGLNPTYHSVDVVWRFSRWPPWQSSWILEQNSFSNSESPCYFRCLPSSFSSIRLTVWEEMLFEDFQDDRHGCHLGYRNRTILAILNLHVATIPTIKFQLNPTHGSGGDVEKCEKLMMDNRPWHKLQVN